MLSEFHIVTSELSFYLKCFYFLALRILRKVRKLCNRAPENGEFSPEKLL